MIERNRALFKWIVIGLLVLTVGGLLGAYAEKFIDAVFTDFSAVPGSMVKLAAAVAVSAALALYIQKNPPRGISSASVREAGKLKPCRFLLCGYSPLTNKKRLPDANSAYKWLKAIEPGTAHLPSIDFRQRNGCAGKPKDHVLKAIMPWQQNVRAAAAHGDKLEAIYVLLPDIDQFRCFRRFMLSVLEQCDPPMRPAIEFISLEGAPDRPFVEEDGDFGTKPADYERFNYVYTGLMRGVNMIEEDFPDPARARADLESEICIDATAGFKTFSIAAAIATLNTKMEFFYVTSGEEGGHVKAYDANVTWLENSF